MSDWPYSATRHARGAVLAEARRRGLMGPDGGAVWLYMFHDIHGVAHFRHVDRRAWMQMLPDAAVPADTPDDIPANDTQSRDIPAGEVSADDIPADDVPVADDAAISGSPDGGTPPTNDNHRKTGKDRP